MSEDLPVETEAATTEGGNKGRRLTDAEFAEIRELYELGKLGMPELSDMYKVSRQTLHKRFKDAGIVKGSRAHELAAAVKSAASSSSASAASAAIERFADKRAAYIEETQTQGYQILKQAKLLGQKIIADALKSHAKIDTVDDELKALNRYVKAQTDILAATLNLLRADEYTDEESLPSLTVVDLTEEDLIGHFQNAGMDVDADDINLEGTIVSLDEEGDDKA